jgi:thioredoxin-related protein
MKIFLMTFMLSYALVASNALEEAKKLGAESDYATAIAKAQKEKKMLVMVIVKENCRWCEKLINKTLSEESVKKRLENYITVIVDKDAKFPSAFTENFFPSIFYIDHMTQKSVYSNVGYVGTKCFLNDLNSSEDIRKSLYKKK